MARNQARRDQIGDAAIEVMAAHGGKGLTHRAVDHEAGLPEGTAKNYFPTYDSLLQATAERCVERYQDDLRRVQVSGIHGREELAEVLRGMLENAVVNNRSQVLAYIELHSEAARRPQVQATLAALSEADLSLHRGVLEAAGLSVAGREAAVFTLAVNTALSYLLTQPPAVVAAYGLDDLDTFVRDLIGTIWPAGRS